jgi:hypothetical protein
MFWIACLAVILAARRYPERFIVTLIGVVAAFVFIWDLLSTVVLLVAGERPTIVLWPRAGRYLHTDGDLWAMVGGCPIRVELVGLRSDLPVQPQFSHVFDHAIDGRAFLCIDNEQTVKPLDLIERGPVLIQHQVYGLCVVEPRGQRS